MGQESLLDFAAKDHSSLLAHVVNVLNVFGVALCEVLVYSFEVLECKVDEAGATEVPVDGEVVHSYLAFEDVAWNVFAHLVLAIPLCFEVLINHLIINELFRHVQVYFVVHIYLKPLHFHVDFLHLFFVT